VVGKPAPGGQATTGGQTAEAINVVAATLVEILGLRSESVRKIWAAIKEFDRAEAQATQAIAQAEAREKAIAEREASIVAREKAQDEADRQRASTVEELDVVLAANTRERAGLDKLAAENARMQLG